MKIDKEQKKNIILGVVMAVIVIGTLIIFFKSRTPRTAVNSVDDTYVPQRSVAIPSRVEEDIFQSEEFIELEDYTPSSFPLEPRGRENPFQPFVIQ